MPWEEVAAKGGAVQLIQGRASEVHVITSGINQNELGVALTNWKQRVQEFNNRTITNSAGQSIAPSQLDHPKANSGNKFGVPLLSATPQNLALNNITAASAASNADADITAQQNKLLKLQVSENTQRNLSLGQGGDAVLGKIELDLIQARQRSDENKTLLSPFSGELASFVQQAKSLGINEAQATAQFHTTNRTFDQRTGMYDPSALQSALNNGIRTLKTTPGQQVQVIELDVGNVGGLNQAVGRTSTDQLLVAPPRILETRLRALGVELNAIRAGGDEFVFVVSGQKDLSEKVAQAINETKAEVARLNQLTTTDGSGTVGDVPNPKYPGDPSKGGIGVYFGVTTITPASTPQSIREATGSAVELAKLGKEKAIPQPLQVTPSGTPSAQYATYLQGLTKSQEIHPAIGSLLATSGKQPHWKLAPDNNSIEIDPAKLAPGARKLFDELVTKHGPDKLHELINSYLFDGWEGIVEEKSGFDLHDLYKLTSIINNFEKPLAHDLQHLIGATGRSGTDKGYGVTVLGENLGSAIIVNPLLNNRAEFLTNGKLDADGLKRIQALAQEAYPKRGGDAFANLLTLVGNPVQSLIIQNKGKSPDEVFTVIKDWLVKSNALAHLTPDEVNQFDSLLRQDLRSPTLGRAITTGEYIFFREVPSFAYLGRTAGRAAEQMNEATFRDRFINGMALAVYLEGEGNRVATKESGILSDYSTAVENDPNFIEKYEAIRKQIKDSFNQQRVLQDTTVPIPNVYRPEGKNASLEPSTIRGQFSDVLASGRTLEELEGNNGILLTSQFTPLARGVGARVYLSARNPSVVIRVSDRPTPLGDKAAALASEVGAGPKLLAINRLSNGKSVQILERLQGQPLANIVKSLNSTERAEVMRQVTDHVAALLNKGVVWTDAHLNNVYIERKSDGSVKVRLLDFDDAIFLDQNSRKENDGHVYKSLQRVYARTLNLLRDQGVPEKDWYAEFKKQLNEKVTDPTVRQHLKLGFGTLEKFPERRRDPTI